MSYRIKCHTLFNVTQTGVTNRRKAEGDPLDWQFKRNTQCNLDTILQVISLRAQPENITVPEKIEINLNDSEMFGFLIQSNEASSVPAWTFEFTIEQHSVFNNGISELGGLYIDCEEVPMIVNLGEVDKLSNFLDISPELRNVYFEITENETV